MLKSPWTGTGMIRTQPHLVLKFLLLTTGPMASRPGKVSSGQRGSRENKRDPVLELTA